ncbi:response regulator [Marinospirillum sp.]|uniref:response regulator n=1 Tax=Marinospirillum sp. TaxID=2183934 RepID=UPI00287023FD|nr:response regulator [Marinospirillum sp.]MDR9467229.1 response regulator [Marinospirillum sp.]
MGQVTRILCVEDDQDIQLLLKLALGKLGGFEVLMATSGEEALQQIEGFSPDLLLLDLMLPGMTGLELFARVRQLPEFTQLPGLLMTARVAPQMPEEWQQPGVLGVLTKPFDPMRLADEVRSYL